MVTMELATIVAFGKHTEWFMVLRNAALDGMLYICFPVELEDLLVDLSNNIRWYPKLHNLSNLHLSIWWLIYMRSGRATKCIVVLVTVTAVHNIPLFKQCWKVFSHSFFPSGFKTKKFFIWEHGALFACHHSLIGGNGSFLNDSLILNKFLMWLGKNESSRGVIRSVTHAHKYLWPFLKRKAASYKGLQQTEAPREFSAPCIQLIKEKCCNFLVLFYDCCGCLQLYLKLLKIQSASDWF